MASRLVTPDGLRFGGASPQLAVDLVNGIASPLFVD